MTILKEGTVKTYIYECGECGCIFTGDSSEIDTWDNVMGISFPVMYCPCCKVKRVSGDAVTEEQLKDIIDELESDEVQLEANTERLREAGTEKEGL